MPRASRHTGGSAAGSAVPQDDRYLTDTDLSVVGDVTVRGNLDLHGTGLEHRLAIAHLANQETASTSFVDLPGATLTITNPTPATLDLIFDVPLSVVSSGQKAIFQVLAGSTVIGLRETPNVPTANHTVFCHFQLALPSPLYTPVAGAEVTYKVQWRSSGGGQNIAVVVDAFGPFNSGYFKADRA